MKILIQFNQIESIYLKIYIFNWISWFSVYSIISIQIKNDSIISVH